jgi:hypothetical protein
MSYGINFQTPFVEGKHDVRDKTWDERAHTFKATNQILWLLKEVSR